jgi:ABC-type nitrate/sulfonate/bicarbonate transport system ATPase subunit
MGRPAAAGTPSDTVAEMILRLHIGSKSFSTDRGELPVLGRIDIALGAREIVALVGPSGCGKTTLLRIVGNLDTDFQGTLDWCGAAIPRIGTVFQEPRLLPWRTVRQNLLLAQRTEDPELADALLRTLDLAAFSDAFPSTLSLGMARRVAIARAFAIAPQLVLLDEPFVSLDPAMAARSRELLLNAWRARPTAALLVTHDRAEAAELADRVLLLGERPTRVLQEIIVPQVHR